MFLSYDSEATKLGGYVDLCLGKIIVDTDSLLYE